MHIIDVSGSKERKTILAKLKGLGDYKYNTTLGDRKHPATMVARRYGDNTKERVPCPTCYKVYVKRWLYKHVARCAGRNGASSKNDDDSTCITTSNRVMLKKHGVANEILRDLILPTMHHDEVYDCIIRDSLIILYGNDLTHRYGNTHLHYHISQRLRRLGRFLINCKKIDSSVNSLANVCRTSKFDTLIAAVKKTARYDATVGRLGTPSVASELSKTLKVCGQLMQMYAADHFNQQLEKASTNFIMFMNHKYSTAFSRLICESMTYTKRNKSKDLPLDDDIMPLNKYLLQQMTTSYQKAKEHFTVGRWRELAKYTLVYLGTKNRKRPGETERIYIEDYNKGKITNVTSGDYIALPEREKMLAQRVLRVEIRGKLGRTVPLLFTKPAIDAVDYIIANRGRAGVPENNPYVFGIRTSNRYMRLCMMLRRCAAECGAREPNTLRATKLRNYAATITQKLDVKRSDITMLAGFMGHEDLIHTKHYRLPVAAAQSTCVMKLFDAIDNKQISNYEGRPISELPMPSKNFIKFVIVKCTCSTSVFFF